MRGAANPCRVRRSVLLWLIVCAVDVLSILSAWRSSATDLPAVVSEQIQQTCLDCHDGTAAEGGLDLTSLTFNLNERQLRERWILIHDRIRAGEMPPDPAALPDRDRKALLEPLFNAISRADETDVIANDRLTQHYGLEPLSGSQMRKVVLPDDSPYGGLLTQAAILKVTANGTSTSPVLRGAWNMERLIGQPPPPPPKSVPAVEPDIRGAKTIRDLLALHTRSESCAVCHARFDPVGLALETFDIMGGWRMRYRGIERGDLVTGIDRAGHDFAYTLLGRIGLFSYDRRLCDS